MHHLSSRYIPCDGRLTASTYFNPRSPWGERPGYPFMYCVTFYFNPRSPHGERQQVEDPAMRTRDISIHAPRRGSDVQFSLYVSRSCYFNPRSPQGERHLSLLSTVISRYFNPRSPQGERPAIDANIVKTKAISIHAPRRGSDCGQGLFYSIKSDFNPRSPQGERRSDVYTKRPFMIDFNPRSPQGERRC